MRMKVTFELERSAWLSMNHQYLLSGLVYRLLEVSDGEYSRFLHDEGYRVDGEKAKRFKLFAFSGLRVPKNRRRPEGKGMWVTPGPVEWFLGSPLEDFLTHSATGLLTVGSVVPVGELSLRIVEISALATPVFEEGMGFSCMTPIVVSVPREDGSTEYLRPREGERFSEAMRRILLHKYRLVTGREPEDSRFRLAFAQDYLQRDAHGGTKKIRFKEIDVVGAMAPFRLWGSPELMRLGWECGFGEKNAGGFGMADVRANGG